MFWSTNVPGAFGKRRGALNFGQICPQHSFSNCFYFAYCLSKAQNKFFLCKSVADIFERSRIAGMISKKLRGLFGSRALLNKACMTKFTIGALHRDDSWKISLI